MQRLDLRTIDAHVDESPVYEAFDEVCQGRDVIHEDPETEKLARESDNYTQFVVLVAAIR